MANHGGLVAAKLGIISDQSNGELLDKIIENKINSPLTSGLGRLFDGVAAIMGVRRKVSFEGQAAMELEGQVNETSGAAFPFEIKRDDEGCFILDMSATIRSIVDGIRKGTSKGELSFSFHQTVARAFAAMAKEIRVITGINRVALSGGCFQNRILLERSVTELESAGFTVYCHKQVPANDGGVALGQAVIAGSIIKKEETSVKVHVEKC